MKFFRLMPIFALALSMMFFNSCTQEDLAPEATTNNAEVDFRNRPGGGGNPVGDQTIVELAIGNPDLSILVDAVIKADLVDVLSNNNRKLTVFAPTNDAFVALLADAGFESLDDVPVDVLTKILLTHVVAGANFSNELSTGYYRTSDQFSAGNYTKIYVDTEDGVTINGSVNVIIPDVAASNGVVHVVNTVIQPTDLLTVATTNPNFSILVQALTRPDLSIDFIGAITSGDVFTVLAPTNDAFLNLLDALDLDSLDDIPVETLEAVLSYHVVPGQNVTTSMLKRGEKYTSLLGEAFGSDFSNREYTILANSNTAKIVVTDVQTSNGVVHAIDTVILP